MRFPGSPDKMFTAGCYRLSDGTTGTYADACRECLEYWKKRVIEAQKHVDLYEAELKKETE